MPAGQGAWEAPAGQGDWEAPAGQGAWEAPAGQGVSVSCRGSDTRAPCSVSLCERAARVRSAARSLVHVCCVCVVLHAVRVFIGCVLSCYVLCEHAAYECSH